MKARFLILFLGCLAAGSVASGQLYRVTLSGQISSTMSASVWDSSVVEGTAFTASFIFDASTPPFGAGADSSVQLPGYYPGVPGGTAFNFGNYTATGGEALLGIFDNAPFALPEFGVVTEGETPLSDGYLFLAFSYSLQSWTHNLPFSEFLFVAGLGSPNTELLNGAHQPVLALPIEAFLNPSFTLIGVSEIDGEEVMSITFGEITGYSVAAIPEPSTFAWCVGALALGAVCWRRRR